MQYCNLKVDYEEKYKKIVMKEIRKDVIIVENKIKELDNKKVSKVKDARKNIEKIDKLKLELHELERFIERGISVSCNSYGYY